MTKKRLDQLLVERGLVESRTRAQALIMAGKVRVGDQPQTKAGHLIAEDAAVTVQEADHPWVSRAGLKLAHAVTEFDLPVMGRVCADIGASTGGFTQVLLHHGAARIYAVDVGYGQLAWPLRQDSRVTVLDKTNARYLDDTIIPEKLNAIVCDASFISLKTVLPAVLQLAAPGAWLAALIKPQFEAGRGQVGKGGIVRDPALHAEICDDIQNWLHDLPGWQVRGITESPITGQEGNKEFLIVADYQDHKLAMQI